MPGSYQAFDQRDWLMAGQPSAFQAESFPHELITSDLAIAGTGIMTCVAIPLQQGDLVTSLVVFVGATAGSVPTHAFGALYSSAALPALLSQSADALAAAQPANSAITYTLAVPQKIATTGVYYAAFGLTGTTIPTLIGKISGLNATVAAVLDALPAKAFPAVAVSSGAAVLGVAPATMASPTRLAVHPYVLAI